ncbi:GMC oxidoreductase [Pontibacter akesuensis]|uniref:Choline dehydrogenase n=1 Tax=Pontibacter akesuensis TaxID=388950 RepID=A0A1I7GHU2_9BACT|nr:GMC family oxidoreductase [Pontibacter akesuensis]GHA56761.1 2-keto-gluconate dehydrogenase subunit [Pontibacter akesuensis]SFU47985.1 Choline dehydrogenase [Pontibacter akesuensis]
MRNENKYALVVVGSSFAATFFLLNYLKKAPANAKVLVLERGYHFPHMERVKERRGEATAFANPNPDYHQTQDTIVNMTPEKRWLYTLGFGGSSNCWFGCTPRFMPNDFRMKTMYGVGEDWPVQYDELEPYYAEVEEHMAISGPAETPFPKTKPYPQPPHLFTDVDRLMKKQYGSLYINQPTARSRVAGNGRNMCCASSVCSICPVNAKYTIENGSMAVFEDPRVEMLYGAQVYSLELDADSVRYVNFVKDGKETKVAGEVVALGANSIFNAHILLNAGDGNPMTGSGLGEQIGLDARVFLKDLQHVGGSTWVNANGYMLYDGAHRKEYAACLMESSNHPYMRVEKGKWRDIVTFRMIFEDLPSKESYVTLSDDRMKPKVHYNGPTEYALKGIETMKQKLPELLACLPVEKITYEAPHNTEAHILGTTRMSTNAAGGVVDRHLIHHQYRNLFVLGSGVFTTFTPSNPTLTLSALSLFAADKSF